MTHTDIVILLLLGLIMGMALTPAVYFVMFQPFNRFWRGWRLHIQTADDFERAVRREVDKRWRDLESERRLRIINLEVEQRLARDRSEQSPAMGKRP